MENTKVVGEPQQLLENPRGRKFVFLFFPLRIFTANTKKTFKSSNKNKNYINQLLKLPLLKHTHIQK